MSNDAKYFSKARHQAMRVARLPVARRIPFGCPATLTVIGFAVIQSYAKVLCLVVRRHCTGLDNLSRLSRPRFKKSGQLQPNEYAVSRLSRLVPTVFNVYRHGKAAAWRVWCAGRDSNSRHKSGLFNATVQLFKVLPGLSCCG